MNAEKLNEAMNYIDDRYLDIADAPQKEIIQMKKTKTMTRVLLIAAVVAMLAISAYAADFLHVKSLLSWTHASYSVFPEMENAMEEAGFRMDVTERFQTGYAFQEVKVKEVHGTDEQEQEVLNYLSIAVFYRNEAGNRLVLAADPVIVETQDTDHPAAQSKMIGKVTAVYYADHYRSVPEDYELTEADKLWMEQPGNFISYGSDEVEETAVGFLCWEKDGVHYILMDPRGAEQPGILFAMAEELILGR